MTPEIRGSMPEGIPGAAPDIQLKCDAFQRFLDGQILTDKFAVEIIQRSAIATDHLQHSRMNIRTVARVRTKK